MAAAPVLLREQDLAACKVDRRVERGRAPISDLVRVDDLLELVGGGSRGLQVAGGDRDLDLRREPPEAKQRVLRLLQRTRDPGDRGVDLAFGEAQEREARLRLAAQLVRTSGTPPRALRSRRADGGSRRSRSGRRPVMQRSKSWSSSQAASACASAAGQSPRSRSTSARWMRHAPGKPVTSSLSHQRFAASVHSAARR